MAQRGRKSQAELGLAKPLKSMAEPPPELSASEASLWRKVVATKPADWFLKDTEQLLIAYCRHASQAAVLDGEIGRFEASWLSTDEGLDRYRKLLDMRDRQTATLVRLSRSMRLTQQSRYCEKSAYRASGKVTQPVPW